MEKHENVLMLKEILDEVLKSIKEIEDQTGMSDTSIPQEEYVNQMIW